MSSREAPAFSRFEKTAPKPVGSACEADGEARLPWREGDVLMVDDMLVAPARNPFEGERKIVVAMGEMVQRSQVA